MAQRAPEILLTNGVYGKESDIWSIGCIFAELLFLKPIFCGENDMDQLNQIFKIRGTPTENTWPGFNDMMKKFNVKFQNFKPINLKDTFKKSNDKAIDLLDKL